MNVVPAITLLFAVSLATLNAANAHDPSLHQQEAEGPKCVAMAGLDHSEMDMDDPVMQAMMMKCADSASESGDGHHPDANESHNVSEASAGN